MKMEETFTTAEAAEMLGVTAARIRQMVLTGIIGGEKRGRDLLIPKSQIEKAKSRKTKPGPTPAAKKEAKK